MKLLTRESSLQDSTPQNLPSQSIKIYRSRFKLITHKRAIILEMVRMVLLTVEYAMCLWKR